MAQALQPFLDRRDGGRALAATLRGRVGGDAIVLALPRGGVPVADEVARALGARLDVVVARKIGSPMQPEYGVGAIAQGVEVLDADALAQLGLSPQDLARTIEDERAEMARRERVYRGARAFPDVRGRLVVLVDDGLATGVTARAAARSLRRLGVARLILAAPVGAPDTVAALAEEVDEVVCPLQPARFRAVGEWYRAFDQTSDDEVLAILRAHEDAPVEEVQIPSAQGPLRADLALPADARALVVFAHGSGSSRKSPRNREVARMLQRQGLATLLLDLLTDREEAEDRLTGEHRFDIKLLARRVESAIDWTGEDVRVRALPIALFGASTGAAAAIVGASRKHGRVAAVVSRGGRPDLAGDALERVGAPTLLLVGSADEGVVELNESALARLPADADMALVPGATHLFEEPGAIEEVARLAAAWILARIPARG